MCERFSIYDKRTISGGVLEENVRGVYALKNVEKLESIYKEKLSESIYNRMKAKTLEIYADFNKLPMLQNSLKGIKCKSKDKLS